MRPTSSQLPWPYRLPAATLSLPQCKNHRLMRPAPYTRSLNRVQMKVQRSEMSSPEYPSTSSLVKFKFLVEAVHQVYVHKDENHEHIDRPLLRKPKAQFKTAQPELIEPIHKQDTCTVRDDKPDRQ